MKIANLLRREKTLPRAKNVTTFNAPGTYIPPYGKTSVKVTGRGGTGNPPTYPYAGYTPPYYQISGYTYTPAIPGTISGYTPGNIISYNPTIPGNNYVTPGNYAGTNPGNYAGANPGNYAGTNPGNYAGANPGNVAGYNTGTYAGTNPVVPGNYAGTNPTTPGYYYPAGYQPPYYYPITNYYYLYTPGNVSGSFWYFDNYYMSPQEAFNYNPPTYNYESYTTYGYQEGYPLVGYQPPAPGNPYYNPPTGGTPYYNPPIAYYNPPTPYYNPPSPYYNPPTPYYNPPSDYYNPPVPGSNSPTPGNANYNPPTANYNTPVPESYNANYSLVPGFDTYNYVVGNVGSPSNVGNVTMPGGPVGTVASIVPLTTSSIEYNGVSGFTVTVPPGGYITIQND